MSNKNRILDIALVFIVMIALFASIAYAQPKPPTPSALDKAGEAVSGAGASVLEWLDENLVSIIALIGSLSALFVYWKYRGDIRSALRQGMKKLREGGFFMKAKRFFWPWHCANTFKQN